MTDDRFSGCRVENKLVKFFPAVDLNHWVMKFSGSYDDLSNGGFQSGTLEDAINFSESLHSLSSVDASIIV